MEDKVRKTKLVLRGDADHLAIPFLFFLYFQQLLFLFLKLPASSSDSVAALIQFSFL
jgi:hypothetical protein